MNKKRAIAILLVVIGCVLIVSFGKKAEKNESVVILDSNKEKVAVVKYEHGDVIFDCEDYLWSYVDYTCREAMDVLEKSLTSDDKIKEFVNSSIVIETSLDSDAMKAMNEACESNIYNIADNKFASMLTDVNGHVKACISISPEADGMNYVNVPTYAGSTIKPISVYGPLVEEKKICWSTMYQDTPYKEVVDEFGNIVPWPTNTEPYSGKDVSVFEAISKSNNAIAVKALDTLGIPKSLEYVSSRFGIDVSKEKELFDNEGKERVLSNLAFGYLDHGVTVNKMTECYQVFANGGVMYPLHSILKITDEKGKEIYSAEDKSTRVFSEETAYIMNKMLHGVVSDFGTGRSAMTDGIDICGKTGTSDDFKDNWFIGMTPEYVCSVWYDGRNSSVEINSSAQIFKDIISNIDIDSSKEFPVADNVKEYNYDYETGAIVEDKSDNALTGYYYDVLPE